MNRPASSKFVPALPSDNDIDTQTKSDTTNSIKIYDGVAECPMNDDDAIKNVKIRAKDLAQDKLIKKTADYVNGFLKDRFLTFPDDEILSIANEIYHITEVKYNVFDSDDNLMIRATVLSQIDDNDIMNCLIRFFNERIELKSQVESLRKENKDLKQENEDLKRQIAELTPKIITKDKVVLAYQKFYEAKKLYDKKDFEGAIKLYSEAIELNPNYAESYNNRGNVYYDLGQKIYAIQDYSKAIKLNPNYAEAYYNRGVYYENLGQKKEAKADFAKAKKLGYEP